jgi:glycosyltransferase involved in cell wall biosynthesis
MVVSKLSPFKSPKKRCSISKTFSVFYALENKCQLHPHLSVALAVSFHARSMLSRTDRLQSALERLCVREYMITAPADTRSDIALAVPSERSVELSIVMPCLNEAETLENCIRKAQRSLSENDIRGEIIIADNGSRDGSQQIARRLGARVVSVSARGYGNALMGGIQAARGEYVVMGDADDSYDFTNLVPFLKKLREGDDLVMGNRFRGGIKPGAMPPLHKYFGNPLLTAIGRLFFRSSVGDFHCGLRGFNRQSILNLDLHATGMEFATEMVVKATLYKLRITEVPTTLSPDGRSRPPHLRTWRDGWRHLRFLLLYSPRWLFLMPGLLLILLGGVGYAIALSRLTINGVTFDVHTLLFASLAFLCGFQAVLFAILTKLFAITEGLLPPDPRLERVFRHITLETGLAGGTLALVAGCVLLLMAVLVWRRTGWGRLDYSEVMRVVIPGATLTVLGFQTVLFSFFMSILGMKRK